MLVTLRVDIGRGVQIEGKQEMVKGRSNWSRLRPNGIVSKCDFEI
jgi:hypothetical protein